MEIYNTHGACLVLLREELDHHTASILRPQIDRELMLTRPVSVTLDFSGVGFMDSSAIGLVMGRYRLVTEWGGEVKLTGLSTRQRRVMQLAGIGKIAVITNKNEEAESDEPSKQDENDGTCKIG